MGFWDFFMGRGKELEFHVPSEQEIAKWVPKVVQETQHYVRVAFPENWAITNRVVPLISERAMSLGYILVDGGVGLFAKIKKHGDNGYGVVTEHDLN